MSELGLKEQCCSEKGGRQLTSRNETRIPINPNRENHSPKPKPRTIRLCPANIRQVLTIKALNFQRAVEEEVNRAHADIINNLRCLCKICKPVTRVNKTVQLTSGRGQYHVMTCAELLPTDKKLRNGKTIVMQKHQIGTPFFVHFLRNFGAWPSRDRE